MKQPAWASLIEALGGTAFGFIIAIPAQYFVNWFWKLPVSHGATFSIVGFFTVVSVARGYVWRRWCVSLGISHVIPPFVLAVLAEMRRQRDVEGWTEEHDDAHAPGELGLAASAYAFNAALDGETVDMPSWWPWLNKWWKPTPHDKRRQWVKAGALLCAEGTKFDRQRKRSPLTKAEG